MPTHIAYARDVAAPHNVRATLWRVAVALKRAWSRRRTRILLADLDDHILEDIGLEKRRPVAGAPLGWAVEGRTRMPSLVFLGR
jgi:uncharacterized protein YjiS (DUF1127 family)